MLVVVLFGSIYAGCSTAWVRIHVDCTTGRERTHACCTTNRSRTCCKLIYVEDCCLVSIDAKDVS
jgi:hypothetical protein